MRETFLIVNIMEMENYINMKNYFMKDNLKMVLLMDQEKYIKYLI